MAISDTFRVLGQHQVVHLARFQEEKRRVRQLRLLRNRSALVTKRQLLQRIKQRMGWQRCVNNNGAHNKEERLRNTVVGALDNMGNGLASTERKGTHAVGDAFEETQIDIEATNGVRVEPRHVRRQKAVLAIGLSHMHARKQTTTRHAEAVRQARKQESDSKKTSRRVRSNMQHSKNLGQNIKALDDASIRGAQAHQQTGCDSAEHLPQ